MSMNLFMYTANVRAEEVRLRFLCDVVRIDFMNVRGRQPLKAMEQALFAEVVRARSADIVQKWIDFFVLNKTIRPERIERRLK